MSALCAWSNRRCTPVTYTLLLFTVLMACCSVQSLKTPLRTPITRTPRIVQIGAAHQSMHHTSLGHRSIHKHAPSKLFLSASNEGKDDNSPKKNPMQNLNRLLLTIYNILTNAPTRLKAFYNRLSRKARIILSLQFILFASVLGYGVKTSMNKRVVKPVEVPYSTFLDLVEVNGKVSYH
jgi:hypothetical protein